MWDWWRGYFAAWVHVAGSADWVGPIVQFSVALLAGVISLMVALITISKNESIAAQKAISLETTAAMNAVTLAFYKLIDCGEILGGMRNLLDEQFIQASADGYASEPYQIVRPAQGQDFLPKRVELNEVLFLVKAKDIALISEISLVYRRTLNCIHLSELHSKERIDFQEWLQGLPGYKGELSGEVASDAFPVEYKDRFDRRAANLNLIITSLVEQVEDTLVLFEDVMARLGKAAKLEFGQEFPVIEAEMPRKLAMLSDIRQACIASKIKFVL